SRRGRLLKELSVPRVGTVGYFCSASLENSELTNIVRMLLKCGNVVTHDTDAQKAYKLTFLKTYRSLLELASRSQLNKTRMVKFLSYEKLYQRLELEIKQQESEKLSSSDSISED
ncbi:hypothetical protein, partial [Pseudomonas amygdali]|uniref:hypothetical protein n=2 Tax=Pseudomonas amygdali TaxID=47877 RepID=UPI000A581F35